MSALDVQDQHARGKFQFERLRDRLCAELQALELQAPAVLFTEPAAQFDFRPWTRPNGQGGGVGGFLQNGRLFEKAGIHTSSASGQFTPDVARTMPGAAEDPRYVSTSISVIIHPRSPRIPTAHMNLRYFATTEFWFGGGADLTPLLTEQRRQDAPDAAMFHGAFRMAFSGHDADLYDRYKTWCDEYFFLPHRGQARGIGGVFFDRHNTGDFERDFAFVQNVGDAFLSVYPKIVRRRMSEPWTDAERNEQLAIRGLYVEFNLLYDRGTMFGLQHGGNVETILSSMPPVVTWM